MVAIIGIVALSLAYATPALGCVIDPPQPAQSAHAATPAVERWRPFIVEASERFGIPQDWIAAVIRAESAGRTHINGRPIVSRAGAMGLMQLMPGTWADMRARLGLGNDPHAPRDNILAGTYYLRLMCNRFGYPGLFGAYNAGPLRYSAYLAGQSSLPGETRAYMAVVADRQDDSAASHADLFAFGPQRTAKNEPRSTAQQIFFIRN